jgi:hypothetical protein
MANHSVTLRYRLALATRPLVCCLTSSNNLAMCAQGAKRMKGGKGDEKGEGQKDVESPSLFCQK